MFSFFNQFGYNFSAKLKTQKSLICTATKDKNEKGKLELSSLREDITIAGV
jgi:hypothetical protein